MIIGNKIERGIKIELKTKKEVEYAERITSWKALGKSNIEEKIEITTYVKRGNGKNQVKATIRK